MKHTKTLPYLILFAYLFMLNLALVSATLGYVQISEFDDGTSKFNITSTTYKNVSLPLNAVITNATVNITGFKGYMSNNNNGTSIAYGADPSNYGIVWINFTAPLNSTSASTITYSVGQNTGTITIPVGCYITTPSKYVAIKFKSRVTSGGSPTGSSFLYCGQSTAADGYSDTDWTLISSDSVGSSSSGLSSIVLTPQKTWDNSLLTYNVYSSQWYDSCSGAACLGAKTGGVLLNWYYDLYPTNVSVYVLVNETRVYNSSFLTTTSKVNLNTTLISDYLSNATYLPIKFELSNNANLQIEALDIRYTAQVTLSINDEETDLPISENMTLEIISDSLNYIKNITITSGTANLFDLPQDSYKIIYKGGQYRERAYFLTVGTSTQEIQLWDIKNTSSSQIVFNIKDEFGNPVKNVIVKVLRQFINRDAAYLTVEMSKTDSSGNAGFYLNEYDTFYEVVVQDSNGLIIQDFLPTKITANLNYLTVTRTSNPYNVINVLNTITGDLSYDNSSKILTFLWNDPSGTMQYACLNVTENYYTTSREIANSCTYASAGTININLTNQLRNNSNYKAIGSVKVNPETGIALLEWTESAVYKQMGRQGVLFGYVFIVTMFFIGIPFSFSIALFYSVIAFVALQFLGITFFGWGFIIFITVIGVTIAIKNRI